MSIINKEQVSEDEVISIFLKGEIKSKRFCKDIYKAVDVLGTDISIINNPNINNISENILRKDILEKTRGYISRIGLFEGLPKDIKWFRVECSKEFILNDIKYINYDYWVELTKGSRLPKDAVKKIEKNERVFNVPYDNFYEASEHFKKNRSFDELILVSDNVNFVVLEGHLRLTVFSINKEILPSSISVIIGYSDKMGEWSNF